MSKTLVIRADANTRMGTGHVMRCIALGQAWQDAGGEVVFVSCCDSEGITNRIREGGFELVDLAASFPESQEDLVTTLKVATQTKAAWIIVDGYQFDLAYQQSLRRAGLKLLLVDDYNHLPQYEADILLNQNISAEGLDYCCNADCRKLLGIRYVMLRREFRCSAGGRVPSERSGNNILVTMGGSDPDNVTQAVLQALHSDLSETCVRVIVGAANRSREQLEKWVQESNLNVKLLKLVTDMPLLMHWADFAISAAGSTCWELMAMEVPFISVVLAENQSDISEQLASRAGMPSAGWVDKEFGRRLQRIFRNRFQLLSVYVGRSIDKIDGTGVNRIVKELQSRGKAL